MRLLPTDVENPGQAAGAIQGAEIVLSGLGLRAVASALAGRLLGKTTEFATRQAARQALSGTEGRAANRFFRGATAKARDFKITQLSRGAKRLEFFSPAKNPGFGKRFVQEIDGAGNILREFKDTIGPGGRLIGRKFIHGVP